MTRRRFDNLCILFGTAYMLGLFLFAAVAFVPAGYKLASAQTATPEPGQNPYVWGCLLAPYQGAAPVCTWGNYFEFDLLAESSHQNDINHQPDVGRDLRLAIIPPHGTAKVGMACSSVPVMQICDDYYCSGGATARIDTQNGYLSLSEGYVHNMNEESGGIVVTKITTATMHPLGYSNVQWTSLITQHNPVDGNWPWDGIRLSIHAWARGDAPDGTSSVQVRMACEVRKIVMQDGYSYVPPGATPLPGVTPTPGGYYTVPYDLVPYPTVPPKRSEFDFAPGTTQCFALPGFSYHLNVLTWEFDVGWPIYEICLEQYGWSTWLVDVNVGLLLSQFVGAITAFWMLKNWMRG